jgi:hypothetical protein
MRGQSGGISHSIDEQSIHLIQNSSVIFIKIPTLKNPLVVYSTEPLSQVVTLKLISSAINDLIAINQGSVFDFWQAICSGGDPKKLEKFSYWCAFFNFC